MTKTELSELLVIIYACERRTDKPSAAVVEAWFPLLSHLSKEQATAAVKEHIATSPRPVSPHGILSLAEAQHGRAAFLASMEAQERLRVPDADPDDPRAFIAAMRDKRFQPARAPEDFPRGPVDVSALGRRVPVAETAPGGAQRPRRWWLKRGRGTGSGDAE